MTISTTVRLRGLALATLASAMLAPAAGAAQLAEAPREAIAIVVHPQSRVDELSFAQLRQVFLGDQQYWPDRTRVTLLVRAPVAYERDVVLDKIYNMSEAQFRQYWIAKIFRAEVTSGPKIVYSNEMVRELISSLSGAISFIRAADAGSDMKVLRIDGRLPGEPGYPLQ